MIGRRTRLLSRTVFRRLFENDLFTSPTAASGGLVWLLAALATPGVMMSGQQFYFYAHARTFSPDRLDRIMFVSQAFHVDFAMAMAGLMTMLVWTSLTPDRRDALVLGPLPVTPGEQARARLLALLQFVAMFAAAVALPTAVVFTFVTVGEAGPAEVVARMTGHAAATLLGAGFVFFALVALQLLLAASVTPRVVAAATLPLQLAALLGLIGAVSFTGRLADALLGAEPLASAWVAWNPAAWFVGVYRWLAGDSREAFAALAARGALAVGGVVALVLVVYPLAYRRCLTNAIAGHGSRTRWTDVALRWWLRVLGPWLRTPLERHLAGFLAATLTRSHAHRFLVASYVGVAIVFALPLAGRLLGPADSTVERYAWFSVPLGLLWWTAAAVRVAMMVPVEPRANWAFQLTEPVDKVRTLSTAVAVLHGTTTLPLAVAFGVASGVAGGATLGVAVATVIVAAGVALAEALTLTLRTVPCTCTYRPGQLRLRMLWPVYALAWIGLAYATPNLALWALGDWTRSLGVVAAWLMVGLALRGWRLGRTRRLRAFVFEESDPSVATTTIDLRSIRA